MNQQEKNQKYLTYGDIFRQWEENNPDLKSVVNDYRPAEGCEKIRIWLNDSTEIIYEYKR